jgi:hypothetical protein
MVAEARAEADDLRAKARTILSDARAEVSVLIAHRDEITRQLGDLSGVIEALAVADRPDGLATLVDHVAAIGAIDPSQRLDPADSAGADDPAGTANTDDAANAADTENTDERQQQDTQSRTEVSTQ